MDLSQGLAVASVYDPWPFDSLVAEHMATQPGKLAGEDYRGCERDSCDGMANDGTGNMDVDGVGVGGGVTLAMARGAAFERGVGSAQRNSFLELQGGAGASIGGAAADRTGRAGAAPNVAMEGSNERQGIAALEASLREMLERMTRGAQASSSADAVTPICSWTSLRRVLVGSGMRGQVHEAPVDSTRVRGACAMT